jgi:4-aminobutyrate aminotransferase / (S)-3-amino-2-methylpropionate transaminase / 5-aminovalerate transaminase
MLTGKELAKVVSPIDERTTSITDKARPYVIGGLPMAPVVGEEAKGAVIKDVQGNIYIDMFAGVGVLVLGHRPDKVVQAIKDQVDKIMCTMVNYCQYSPDLELAVKLASITPFGEPMRVVLSSAGAEAVENAVKIAKLATGKQGIITLTNAFHGRTLLTSAMTHKCAPQKNGQGPQPSEIYRLEGYYYYRYGYGMSKEQYIQRLLDDAEFNLANTIDAENCAAIIVEPVQGEGGFLPQPVEFIQGLKKLTDKYGILWIDDDIQTGFYRTGKFFGVEHYGFAPDIMCVAKALGGGLPLSACLVKSSLDKIKTGQLGGTYMGNAVACAAANASIDMFKEHDYGPRAIEIGKYIVSRLEKIQKVHPQLGDIRCLGSMVAAEFVEDPATKKPAAGLLGQILGECRKRGALLLAAGMRGNNMRFLPPLVITDDQLAQVMDIIEESCDVVLK